WRELSLKPDQYHAYQGRLKYILDQEAAEEEAKMREQEAVERGLQKGLQEGLQQGLEQGLQEGLEQGLQEGEMKALSRMIMIQLTQKFGELPKELKHVINQANMEALNNVVSNIFMIDSLDEVKKHLQ
ncbi:DUF4351 domain-containing protein, partial [Lysinibacillus piscis]|uniref:DUF4351 domain-containing protein n=1 Tax=Lysinibacillus piscis TaxID=2518931 RepID=UPI0022304DFC